MIRVNSVLLERLMVLKACGPGRCLGFDEPGTAHRPGGRDRDGEQGLQYAFVEGEPLWKESQGPEKRSEPFAASDFCEISPQYTDHDTNRGTPQIILGNEDCLYLNIWRPKSREDKLPVYFWIHGGGNSVQWPLLSWLDGSILANRSKMIVVSANYGLGPMGWFSHPALRTGQKGDEKTDSGNFGTLGLIKALSWVQGNIKAFGGDPPM